MSKLDKNLSEILDVDPLEKIPESLEDDIIFNDISYKPSREIDDREKGRIIQEFLKKEEQEKNNLLK